MNGFTCCNGTALESNTKLQDSIYFRSADNRTLYVNLFVPSTLTWRARNLTVQQVTDFPYADTTKLLVKGSGSFDLQVRVPHWAGHGFFVSINGRDRTIKAEPGTYVSLGKSWRANDTIAIRMPFAESISPITHGNWEGTGVVPDVPTTADAALDEAVKRATTATKP